MLFSFYVSGPPAPPSRRHRLAGTVTVDGTPAKRLVAAINRKTLVFIAAVHSDPTTGEWELTGLEEMPEKDIIVLALDNTGAYNAEVADYVTQVTTT